MSDVPPDVIDNLKAAMVEAAAEILRLRDENHEAASCVESVICMRTNFTGEPPYVGWKGLGLALNEALDERDRLHEEVQHWKDSFHCEREDHEATIKALDAEACRGRE